MNYATKQFYERATSQENVYPKALAHFLFREIIEDIHSKYHIPDEEIKIICKEAVNRAAVFLEMQKDPDIYRGFAIEAIYGIMWDKPQITKDLKERLEIYKEIGEEYKD